MPNGTATLPEEKVREERHPEMERRDWRAGGGGGALAGGIVAAVAGIFAIAGLAGVYPTWLLSLAAIGIGVSFLLEGLAIGGRLSGLLRPATEGRTEIGRLGAGTMSETLAGITGITLGILGFLGVVPVILALCASVVFGAALMIGYRTRISLHRLLAGDREDRYAAHQTVFVTAGVQVLMGLAVFTLAIIGLADVAPLALSLVAVLIAAVALVLTNPIVVNKVTPALRP
jgi:hypothetical protein